MAKRALLVLARGFEGSDIRDEVLGDGVRVVKMREQDLQTIYQQSSHHVDKWDLFHGGHSHAIVNEYETQRKPDAEAEQEIVRAFVALRIIKPTPLALHLVVQAEGEPPDTIFTLENRIGMYSLTYVSPSDINNRVTRKDVTRAKVLWPNIQHVFQDWQHHIRLVRAIRFFEIAYSNYNAEVRHILFHTGLECLLCTHSEYIGQQLTSRVKAIYPAIDPRDLRMIGKLRGGFVHSGAIIEEARGREAELGGKLEKIFRACLYHVLADRESVSIFADAEEIKKQYPVEVKKIVRRQTDDLIFV